MQQRGTEDSPGVLGRWVACRDGQRRVWRAIDLLRQTERAAKPEAASVGPPAASAQEERRRAVGE